MSNKSPKFQKTIGLFCCLTFSRLLKISIMKNLTISFCFLLLHVAAASAQGDAFHEKAYWFNTEFKISLQSCTTKMVLVVITDLRCEESNYYLHELSEKLIKLPQVQLIQVLLPDTQQTLSRAHLVQYAQLHNFSHPIGIFPDLSGFKGQNITSYPHFLLYHKSLSPTYSNSGYDAFYAVMKKLDECIVDPSKLREMELFLFKPMMDPSHWANPTIECPTYFAVGDEGEMVINDAAHHRLIVLDKKGEFLRFIGNTLVGYSDESVYNASFNHPHGFCFDGNDIYIADTYNHRVRKVDMTSEMVSTVCGNGYFTNKKQESIDGIHEPLGMPIDVAVLNEDLFVASYSTGQILKVNKRNGECELFCDIPDDGKNHLRRRPVNLSAGLQELYIVTNDGKVYIADLKGKVKLLDSKLNTSVNAVCNWEDGIAALTTDGHVLFFKNKKWITVGQSDNAAEKNWVTCSYPRELQESNGSLFISDTENHRIRELENSSDMMMKNFWWKCSMEMVGFDAAHTYGELVVMDSVFLDGSDIRMNVILDLEGYEIVKAGQNELISHDMTGKVRLKSETIHQKEFSFTVESDYPDVEIYMELYLTLEKPEEPGIFIVKRAYLDFPVTQSKKAEAVEEQIFKPNLLPY